jgi:alpha-glucosidase
MSHTGQLPIDPLILAVFPLENGQVSKYRLYDDAGDTPGYRNGECTWTPIQAAANSDGTSLTVTVSPTTGHYQGMPTTRAYQLRLPGNWPPASVSINGEPLAYSSEGEKPGWKFEGDTLTTVVTTRRFPMTDAVTIKVQTKPHSASDRALLDGFAGKMTRLRETYDILNAAWPAGSSPNSLVDAMQTGDRLKYRPETTLSELKGLAEKIPALTQVVGSMRATETSPVFAALSKDKQNQSQKLEQYNSLVDLALAHMIDLTSSSADSTKEQIQQGQPDSSDARSNDPGHPSPQQ